jgi:branched-chain amino acid transport system ATP-binding protein
MLQLENVTVRFGGLTAVDKVSLTVGSGDVVGLVGANGAGKTTLFNAISGLARTDGRIVFDGRDVLRAPMYQRARMGIGRTDLRRIDEILEFTNLTAKAGRDAATGLALSELKALEVAKALATNPKLLLLDEVLAGLETNGKRHFMNMLKQMHDTFKVGILIIEHDIETISNLCQRVAVLNFGQLIAEGTPTEVFNDPAVVKSYTGAEHA